MHLHRYSQHVCISSERQTCSELSLLLLLRAVPILQELARGRSLADLVHGGWSASEEEVTCIARQLLQLLQYLSSRSPPIVHRQVLPTAAVPAAMAIMLHLPGMC